MTDAYTDESTRKRSAERARKRRKKMDFNYSMGILAKRLKEAEKGQYCAEHAKIVTERTEELKEAIKILKKHHNGGKNERD